MAFNVTANTSTGFSIDTGNTVATFNSSTGGDGEAYANNATWATVRAATTGTADNTSTTAAVYTEPGFWIGRVFLPFDSSALPDGATIVSAKVRVYVDAVLGDNDNDGDDFIRLVESTQATSTGLVNGDFDQLGTTALANDIDITSISAGGFIEFILNSTGLALLNDTGYTQFGLREGHDINNNPTGTGITGIRINTSDNASNDPELVVAYTVGVTDTPVTPGIASLTTSLFAPIVTTTNNVAITTLAPTALTTTAFAPTVAATNNYAITTASPSSLTITTFAPTVSVSANTAITTASPTALTTTTFAPTVAATNNVAITTLSPTALTTTTWSPTVAFTANYAITTASPTALTLTGLVPTVSATNNVVVTPGAASLTLTQQTPSVSAGANVAVVPSTTSLTLTAFAPTIATSDNKTATPDIATLSLTQQTPNVVVNQILTPGVASLTLTTFAPDATASSGSLVLTPGVVNMITTMFAPTVFASDNTYVTPQTAQLRLRGTRPIVNGIVPTKDYYIDSSGNIYWVLNQDIGLVERI